MKLISPIGKIFQNISREDESFTYTIYDGVLCWYRISDPAKKYKSCSGMFTLIEQINKGITKIL